MQSKLDGGDQIITKASEIIPTTSKIIPASKIIFDVIKSYLMSKIIPNATTTILNASKIR